MSAHIAHPLDVSTFPLLGRSLIEASAGTGKTYTIASLYSRLALGHNTGLAPLGCDQVLVVTFTKAATEELRGRIRERLRANLEDLLRCQAQLPLNDGLLQQWLEQLDWDEDQLQRSIELLQANVSAMDDASIYTIHGFCQRMLKQFAFDSGVMFSADLELDTTSWLRQACEDVWRRHLYRADLEHADVLRRLFASPEALMEKIRSWFSRPETCFQPEPPTTSAPDDSDARQAFERAGKLAREHGWQTLQDLLQEAIATKNLNNNSYRPKNFPDYFRELKAWLTQGFSLKTPQKLELFGQQMLAAKTSKKGITPEHPFFVAIDDLLQALEPLQQYQQLFERTLAKVWFDEVKVRYFELLELAGALSPDDLLRLLDQALQGPNGQHLAAQIRGLYPIALIDEFQDTDPLQYRIFDTIYQTCEQTPDQASNQTSFQTSESAQSNHSQACGLTAIGDPKQAIYAFRGADIFTYIQARRAMPAERIFTLDTNWRSHSKVIAGVNSLFERHPAPFVFDEDIPFVSVKAAAQHDDKALTLNGQPVPPVQLWLDKQEQPQNKEAALNRCASECAESIAAMLGGAAQLGSGSVSASDIAVLVRTNSQAVKMRDALAAHGITAVMLSRDSVFDSDVARELLSWLSAVSDPADERLLRNALATRLHGFGATELVQLQTDERMLEAELENMQRLHQRWLRNGVMAVVLEWLSQDQRAARIRQQPSGERNLTDLLHLAELLQQASRRLRGSQALLRWFVERVTDSDNSNEDSQLRLESDANLVSIVTIHKSKGLEYPLVFLPFLWADSNQRYPFEDVLYFDDQQGVVLDLDADDEAKAAANRDKRAEAMRLLYVALTRPVQGCFIWLTDALSSKKPVLDKSGLGDLIQSETLGLDGLTTLNDDNLYLGPRPQLMAATGSAAILAGTDASDRTGSGYSELRPATFERLIDQRWRVSSFTALCQHYPVAGPESSSDDFVESDSGSLRQDETVVMSAAINDLAAAQELIHEQLPTPFQRNIALQFPKGAQAGTCLHHVFENWDFADTGQLRDVLAEALQRYGLIQPLSELEELVLEYPAPEQPDSATVNDRLITAVPEPVMNALVDWFVAMVNTPLSGSDDAPVCLSQVPANQRLDEMEFCLPVQDLYAEQINTLLLDSRNQTMASDVQRPKLQFLPMGGYLKGFIDLIFCWQGKYYVLDYKSNYLGDQPEDYQGATLDQAMALHNYDLQGWIYTLAMDQFLSQRLPDYDPAVHLGGTLYLFLRGMQAFAEGEQSFDDGQTGVWFRPIELAALEQWRRRLLRGEASSAVKNNPQENKSEVTGMASGSDDFQQGELPL